MISLLKNYVVILERLLFDQLNHGKKCMKNETKKWIDLEILNEIKKRDKFFMKFKKTKSYNDYQLYKAARNNLQRII